MARTTMTMLNYNGESEHPCLIPDLRGNAFSFSPLRIIFGVDLSHIDFIMLMQFPFSFIFWRVFFFFNHKCIKNETFLCIYLEDYMIFILQFVNTVYHIDWFCVLKNPCIPDINFTWSWCLILLMCYWIEFASILLRIFVCIFICDIGRKNRKNTHTQKPTK